jgi:hypothetical protein
MVNTAWKWPECAMQRGYGHSAQYCLHMDRMHMWRRYGQSAQCGVDVATMHTAAWIWPQCAMRRGYGQSEQCGVDMA